MLEAPLIDAETQLLHLRNQGRPLVADVPQVFVVVAQHLGEALHDSLRGVHARAADLLGLVEAEVLQRLHCCVVQTITNETRKYIVWFWCDF